MRMSNCGLAHVIGLHMLRAFLRRLHLLLITHAHMLVCLQSAPLQASQKAVIGKAVCH